MKYNRKNIEAYIVGNLRYNLYYSVFKFLIRQHIREQIEYRINSMDVLCYNDGQCKICGCKTTALQMANKACDKPCYPKMLNKEKWNRAISRNYYHEIEKKILWKLLIKSKKFIKHELGKEYN